MDVTHPRPISPIKTKHLIVEGMQATGRLEMLLNEKFWDLVKLFIFEFQSQEAHVFLSYL